MMERVEDSRLCVLCGGLCCQRAPGRYAPEELASVSTAVVDAGSVNVAGVDVAGVDVASVEAMLDAGFSSITASFIAVCDRRAAVLFTLAVRGVGRGELVLCASDTRCLRLGAVGCTLALGQRPFECAMMVPHQQVPQCRIPDNLMMEEIWLPHQEVLRQVVERRSGLAWAEELKRQVFSAPTSDQYAQGARELLTALGLATDPDEILAVIERAWADR
jgi:hypothetical protein